MELSEYILRRKEDEPGFSQNKFAAELGVHKTTMVRVVRSRLVPSGKLALSIEKATKGKVSGWQLILKALKIQEEKRKNQTGKEF